ncbi:MAG: hypothetical protein A4E35_01279 [Methanoregula sp. PtaU1.Bin051]|nr:MAG: hypothetical protein A4E35_01279 [Methanoregula sp. PtaU1.Bin051]
MQVKVLEFDEEASFFTSQLKNRENDLHYLPSRAFRKTSSDFYDRYLNEVLIGIRTEDLSESSPGYDNFSRTIEPKLRKKSVSNEINLITFFGDRDIDLNQLLSFEDINLLADFEQRYNDHLVSLPFTLKFREDTYNATQILNDIRASYSDFASTLRRTNLLGYVPAYVSHRELENFIRLYLDTASTINTPVGTLNYVPLLIDCKNSLPDKFKRSLAKLRQLKLKYLDEGTYLSYYGFSLGTPRVSEKKQINTTLAKEFLLSFLGFDIIGGSHTRIKPGGGGNAFDEKAAGVFARDDFSYHLRRLPKREYDRTKPSNFADQTEYLSGLSRNMQTNRELAKNELHRRREAFDYVESYR